MGRAELRGVFRALCTCKPREHLVVVLDSEYVYKGMMARSPKWRCHSWWTASGEVAHKDLWETILLEREVGGGVGGARQLRWVPSHLGGGGGGQGGGGGGITYQWYTNHDLVPVQVFGRLHKVRGISSP